MGGPADFCFRMIDGLKTKTKKEHTVDTLCIYLCGSCRFTWIWEVGNKTRKEGNVHP